MSETSPAPTVAQLVAAALPAAIQAAVTADPIRFVEAGLAAEASKLKQEAELAFKTVELKVQALLHLHHTAATSTMGTPPIAPAITAAQIDNVIAGGTVAASAPAPAA